MKLGRLREDTRRWRETLPLCLTVMNAGIKEPERDREDHPEDPIEGVPRDDQPQHGIAGLADPIQIVVRRFLAHKQHDSCVTVERGHGKKIKCAEEKIQNE